MALVHNSQVFSSFPAIKSGPYPKIMKSRTLKISASNNSEDKPQDQKVETDPVKLAFLKAKAYKKETKLDDKVVPSADKLALDSNTVQESETNIFLLIYMLSLFPYLFPKFFTLLFSIIKLSP